MIRRASTALLCHGFFLALAINASAQTTPTERQAAKSVLESIDRLQAEMAPTRVANTLATKADPARDRVLQRVEAHWNGGMQALSDWIGHNPEVGFKEFKAVDTLTKVLRAAGFRVDAPVAGLATAFVATWDSPAGTNGPTLGLIAEYDALRGTKGDFHGDQHNAQSPVAIAVARALMEHMTERRVPGLSVQAAEVDPERLSALLKPNILEGACSAPKVRDGLLKRGVTMRYSYADKNRVHVTAFDVAPADCGLSPQSSR